MRSIAHRNGHMLTGQPRRYYDAFRVSLQTNDSIHISFSESNLTPTEQGEIE